MFELVIGSVCLIVAYRALVNIRRTEKLADKFEEDEKERQ